MGNCGDEWKLYRRFRRAATGDVLIAGLGLGLDLLQIAMKRDVKKIVVVEKKQIIIDLVWPYIPHHRATLVHQDIRLYLRETKQKFDVIYFDIFPGGGESFPVTTAELRKLATPRLKPNGRIIFFREFLVSDDTRRTGET
jgi:spermidine synthase